MRLFVSVKNEKISVQKGNHGFYKCNTNNQLKFSYQKEKFHKERERERERDIKKERERERET